MREAAFEIALARSDFAPSLAERLAAAARAAIAHLVRRHRAAADLERLREMEPHRLADLGLTPVDLVGLSPDLDAAAATRELARRARRRLADRWERAREARR